MARASTLFIATVLAGAALWAVGGCDTESGRADKRIEAAVNQAMPKFGGTAEDLAQAQSLLSKAASETAASLPKRIQAKVLLAQSELQAAQFIQPKIDETTGQINRLEWDIDSLTRQIQDHNQLAAALAKYDPAKLKAAITAETAAAQGSADKPDWVKSDSGSVPTLAAVTAASSALQDQINQLQENIKSLSDQRSQLQTSGDQLTSQSELAKGDDAVKLFKQAAAARQKADDLSQQIDQANVQLSRAQADLAVNQGQQAVIGQAITDFANISANSGSSWAQIQQQIAAQHDQVKAILGDENAAAADDTTGGSTVASKAAALNKLALENAANREQALAHLNNAVEFYQDAAKLAAQFTTELQTRSGSPGMADRPDAAALKALMATLNPGRYHLEEANVEIRRGSLFAAQLAEATARQQMAQELQTVLSQAGMTLPASLSDSDNKVAQATKDGREQADLAYQGADGTLANIVEGTAPEDVRKAARSSHIFAQYGWYLLDTAVGDAQAADHLKAAEADRDEMAQAGGTMFALPPQLAVAPTTAPAGAAAPTP